MKRILSALLIALCLLLSACSATPAKEEAETPTEYRTSYTPITQIDHCVLEPDDRARLSDSRRTPHIPVIFVRRIWLTILMIERRTALFELFAFRPSRRYRKKAFIHDSGVDHAVADGKRPHAKAGKLRLFPVWERQPVQHPRTRLVGNVDSEKPVVRLGGHEHVAGRPWRPHVQPSRVERRIVKSRHMFRMDGVRHVENIEAVPAPFFGPPL